MEEIFFCSQNVSKRELLNSSIVVPSDSLTVVEPVEVDHFGLLAYTLNVRTRQRTDKLAVTYDGQFLACRQWVHGDVLPKESLKRLSTIENILISLELFKCHKRRDPCVSQIFVGKVVFQL